MGKCQVCEKETEKVLFSKAIVPIYICSEKCLKEYYKPLKKSNLRIQKRLTDDDAWFG